MRSESDGAETEAEVRSLVGGLSTAGFLDYMAVAAGGDSKVTLQQYAKQVCALGVCVCLFVQVCVHWEGVCVECVCRVRLCLFVRVCVQGEGVCSCVSCV